MHRQNFRRHYQQVRRRQLRGQGGRALASGDVRAAVRAEIASIYAVHNPEKLDNIDAFLDEAGPGNEEVLLEAIQDKYGVPRSS